MNRRKPNLLVRFLRPAHTWLYQLSGGLLGTRLLDMPVLLLRTVGRKTGKRRVRALSYLFDQGKYVLAASNGGADYHPDWWLNLEANPKAAIQVGSKRIDVTAYEVEGEERAKLWQRFVKMEERYANYEKRTKRRIPVVILIIEEKLESN
jgi:deazaflavin-dependent oxidoreductase (nitroreductase family)